MYMIVNNIIYFDVLNNKTEKPFNFELKINLIHSFRDFTKKNYIKIDSHSHLYVV